MQPQPQQQQQSSMKGIDLIMAPPLPCRRGSLEHNDSYDNDNDEVDDEEDMNRWLQYLHDDHEESSLSSLLDGVAALDASHSESQTFADSHGDLDFSTNSTTHNDDDDDDDDDDTIVLMDDDDSVFGSNNKNNRPSCDQKKPNYRQRRVQFDPILEIREYNITVGSYCGIDDTCPIQCDWDYVSRQQCLDDDNDYDVTRPAAGVRRFGSITQRRKRIARVRNLTLLEVCRLEQQTILYQIQQTLRHTNNIEMEEEEEDEDEEEDDEVVVAAVKVHEDDIAVTTTIHRNTLPVRSNLFDDNHNDHCHWNNKTNTNTTNTNNTNTIPNHHHQGDDDDDIMIMKKKPIQPQRQPQEPWKNPCWASSPDTLLSLLSSNRRRQQNYMRCYDRWETTTKSTSATTGTVVVATAARKHT